MALPISFNGANFDTSQSIFSGNYEFDTVKQFKQNAAQRSADLKSTAMNSSNTAMNTDVQNTKIDKPSLANGKDKEKKPFNAEKAGQIAGTVGQAADMLKGFIKDRPEYSGAKGHITQGVDKAYDAISDAAMKMGPYGQLVGGIMKGGALLNKGIGRLGGGTDGMTTTDAILGSSFLGLTPLGLINGFGGKKAMTYTRNAELDAASAGGFEGFLTTEDETSVGAGKKYGLFSSGARKKQDAMTEFTTNMKHTISGIVDSNTINNLAAQGSTPFIANQQSIDLSGGIQQMRAARFGMKIPTLKYMLKAKDIDQFQKSGQFAKRVSSKYKTAKKPRKPQVQDTPEPRSIEELITYAKQVNPEFIQRLDKDPIPVYFRDERYPELLHGTHYMTSRDNKVFPSILPNDEGQMTYYELNDATNRAYNTGNYIEFNSPEEAELFAQNYKQGWPEFFEKYEQHPSTEAFSYKKGGEVNYIGVKEASTGQVIGIPAKLSDNQKNGIDPIKTNAGREVIMLQDGNVMYVEEKRNMVTYNKKGGQMNVIPEGALHARLNHLEDIDLKFKDVTTKGIPVITEEEGGEIIQHAEVEHSEIIFNKEVTDKLESLRKDGSDEAAIEAGKLLVDEIFNNTDDRVGLIDKVE